MHTRLFTAVELPRAVVDALVALQPPAERGVKPVGRERMHLTLHFIGDAEPEAVTRALEPVRAAAFELEIGALGMFSRRGRPAALWAGVEHSEPLHALHGAIGEALAAAGYALDTRAYRPHVTLARLTPRASRATIRACLARAAPESMKFRVEEFVLLASETTEAGPVYTPRARFALEP